MSGPRRQQMLAAALLATLLAAWLPPDDPVDGGTAVAALKPMPELLEWPLAPDGPSAASATNDAAPFASGIKPPSGRRASSQETVANADPALPPAPPFRMFGRFERDGETLAFVNHAGRTLTVAAGQQLPGEWQVESIGNDGMVLTYLPLAQTARIPFKAPAQ